MAKPPLIFTFYIAAPIEKVWNGFVSKEANQTIFMGADFEVDLRPGGAMTWSGLGKDGQWMRYVTGEVLAVEAPTRLEYKFGMGDGAVMSRVTIASLTFWMTSWMGCRVRLGDSSLIFCASPSSCSSMSAMYW